MKKELSAETCEHIFKKMRVKSSQLEDGTRFLYFQNQALWIACAVRCSGEGCKIVGTINSGQVDAATTPESALLSLPFCHSANVIPEQVGCYDEDGSGDVLCFDCIAKRKAGAA